MYYCSEFTQLLESRIKSILESSKTGYRNLKLLRTRSGLLAIPKGCCNSKLTRDILSIIKDKLLTETINVECERNISSIAYPVVSITQDDHGSISVELDRAMVFNIVISAIMKTGERYGHSKNLCFPDVDEPSKSTSHGSVILYSPEIYMDASLCGENVSAELRSVMRQGAGDSAACQSPSCARRTPSATDLRTLLLLQHTCELLQANSYTVYSVNDNMLTLPSETEKQLGCFNMEINSIQKLPSFESTLIKVNPQLLAKVYQCQYRYSDNESDESNDQSDVINCMKKSVCQSTDSSKDTFQNDAHGIVSIDLRNYIEDENISLGKGGCEKAFNHIAVLHDGLQTVQFLEACLLETATQVTEKHLGIPAKICVHIGSAPQSHHRQQTGILWRMLAERRHVAQVHLDHGPVIVKGHNSSQLSAEELLSIHQKQMLEAATMKYGDKVLGSDWEERISILTMASLKFDMLSTVHRNPVKLQLSSDSSSGISGLDNKAGAFVMYNCARLSMISAHFQEQVAKGVYPCLPPVNEVDFSLLKQEDEWLLLFQFIWPFPDLVRETVCVAEDTQHPCIHTHKICTFLRCLTQKLSSYYSRTHVLGEALAHVLPVMYARLYLLNAVHTVMVNALHLLGIQPVSQM